MLIKLNAFNGEPIALNPAVIGEISVEKNAGKFSVAIMLLGTNDEIWLKPHEEIEYAFKELYELVNKVNGLGQEARI